MGPATDAMAVVNQHCQLRTIPNLRVVDASVMPTIPRANINLTCTMIAEQVSDRLRDDS
jgi:choline dehydrogenase-like flavoprotein